MITQILVRSVNPFSPVKTVNQAFCALFIIKEQLVRRPGLGLGVKVNSLMPRSIYVCHSPSLLAPVVQWMFNGCSGVMFYEHAKICFNVQ